MPSLFSRQHPWPSGLSPIVWVARFELTQLKNNGVTDHYNSPTLSHSHFFCGWKKIRTFNQVPNNPVRTGLYHWAIHPFCWSAGNRTQIPRLKVSYSTTELQTNFCDDRKTWTFNNYRIRIALCQLSYIILLVATARFELTSSGLWDRHVTITPNHNFIFCWFRKTRTFISSFVVKYSHPLNYKPVWCGFRIWTGYNPPMFTS